MTKRVALLGGLLLLLTGFFVGDRAGRVLARRAAAGPEPLHRMVESRSAVLDARRLRGLGYVDGTIDANSELVDVILHDPSRSLEGYNFYSSRAISGARLIDMAGKLVHEWTADTEPWQSAYLLPDGSVLGLCRGTLVKLDLHSQVLWTYDGGAHHDLDIGGGGEIYVNVSKPTERPEIHAELLTMEDGIAILEPDGQLREVIPLFDIFLDSPYAFLLPSVDHLAANMDAYADQPRFTNHLDLLHTNHVEVFDGRLEHLDPLYKAGNLLVSMRNINSIAILDRDDRSIEWLWGPSNLTFQHHPTLLDDGGLLLFDNGVEQSRILEVDPLTRRIRWEWTRPGLFTETRGSNQRLRGGNTLVTESNKGYVMEVTHDGEVVWEFANPDVAENDERAAIWRMTRYLPEELDFLDAVGRG